MLPESSQSEPPSVLVTGVSPFEDLPGYHYASLLRGQGYDLLLADDSAVALRVLRAGGADVAEVPHPGPDERGFLKAVDVLVSERPFVAVVPGTDAHLFALARAADALPWVRTLCPTAGWLADEGLQSKWDLQEWVLPHMPTPDRWPADETALHTWFSNAEAPKVVVKGLRKGAVPCDTPDELTAAARFLMRNPANQDAAGGLYLERHVEGEEHSVLVVRLLDRTVVVGIRKLAATQSGTTVAAVVEQGRVEAPVSNAIADRLRPGMAVEVEWREADGGRWAFEVNVRFPSWVGAMGPYGRGLLSASLGAQLGRSSALPPPLPEGTLIYRLPQGGPLTPDVALGMSGSPRATLWPSASPHQFLVK